jgi:ATP-dependent HslUV protease ATP-binding subunit HslU
MVRDLVEISIRMVQSEKVKEVEEKADELAIERLVNVFRPRRQNAPAPSPISILFGGGQAQPMSESEEAFSVREQERDELRERIRRGDLDDKFVEIEIEESAPSVIEMFTNAGMEEVGVNFQDILGGILPKRRKKRNVKISEAKVIFAKEEAHKLIDMDEVKREGIVRVERHGIIFIDEMDKIAGREKGYGPDVSREGVQRDILPIVEGSTVTTKYGPARTDHILFIAAGAFHVAKPSDLIPELQGRFPIRVELKSLTREDFLRILTEPDNALVMQYTKLLETEGLTVDFTEDGLEEIALMAESVNDHTENIGARRLHTMLEKVLEELSFDAPDMKGKAITIDRAFVRKRLEDIVKNEDLSRFVL